MSDELELANDHLSPSVEDLDGAKRFCEAALAPLGLELTMELGPEVTGRLGLAPTPG